MKEIGLIKQGWRWLLSQKLVSSRLKTAMGTLREKFGVIVEHHWPLVCNGCSQTARWVILLMKCWKNCVLRGCKSLACLGSASLLLIIWSCFLSLTSISCVVCVLLSMGAAGGVVRYLGFTPGLFIVGFFSILITWMFANFWMTGTLLIVGAGYLFSLNHARLVVFMAAIYAIYCVKIRAGWIGILISLNLTFISNDVLNLLLQWCDHVNANSSSEEKKESESILQEEFPQEYPIPADNSDKIHPCKNGSKVSVSSSVVAQQKECVVKREVKQEASSIIEMKRIINSSDYYEALGFHRHKKVDAVMLKKEYRKKAMIVHPDKNMGSQLASESFKKLQCAYEILSDFMKKRDYDDQLRKQDLRAKSVCQKSYDSSRQVSQDYCAEESRRIQCSRCGNSHIWVCTNRSRLKARWCEDCNQYHPAKDGDGWVEHKSPQGLNKPPKNDIPRAFVCAESKIFDASEWATCQGMACRSNTHRPSFHVNMVGMEKSQRASNGRYPWDLDAEMMEEDDEEFELWLQEALASGLFCETSMRRKSWTPFKLNLKGKKQWRRTST